MNRAAPGQLKHKNLVKGGNPTALCPRAPWSGVFSGHRVHSSNPSDPELELLSRQCQQQLLETTDTVILSITGRYVWASLITRLEDRKRTLARVTRLWSALGPCSCLEPTPPPRPTHPGTMQAVFGHCNANSQLGPKRGPVSQLLLSL